MPKSPDTGGLHPLLPSPWKDAMMFLRALCRRWRWIAATLVFFLTLSAALSLCIGSSFRITGNILFPVSGEKAFTDLSWDTASAPKPNWYHFIHRLRELKASGLDIEDAAYMQGAPPLPLMTISQFNRMWPVLARADSFLAQMAREMGRDLAETRYLRHRLSGTRALSGCVKKVWAYDRSEIARLVSAQDAMPNHLVGLELRMWGTSTDGARNNLAIWARYLKAKMSMELIRIWIRRQRGFLGRIIQDYQNVINWMRRDLTDLIQRKALGISREGKPVNSLQIDRRLASVRQDLSLLRRECWEVRLWRRCLNEFVDSLRAQEFLRMEDVDRILGRFSRGVTDKSKFTARMQRRVSERVRGHLTWAIRHYDDMIRIDLPGEGTAVPVEPGLWTLLVFGVLLGIPVSLVLACGADRVLANRERGRRTKGRIGTG